MTKKTHTEQKYEHTNDYRIMQQPLGKKVYTISIYNTHDLLTIAEAVGATYREALANAEIITTALNLQ